MRGLAGPPVSSSGEEEEDDEEASSSEEGSGEADAAADEARPENIGLAVLLTGCL